MTTTKNAADLKNKNNQGAADHHIRPRHAQTTDVPQFYVDHQSFGKFYSEEKIAKLRKFLEQATSNLMASSHDESCRDCSNPDEHPVCPQGMLFPDLSEPVDKLQEIVADFMTGMDGKLPGIEERSKWLSILTQITEATAGIYKKANSALDASMDFIQEMKSTVALMAMVYTFYRFVKEPTKLNAFLALGSIAYAYLQGGQLNASSVTGVITTFFNIIQAIFAAIFDTAEHAVKIIVSPQGYDDTNSIVDVFLSTKAFIDVIPFFKERGFRSDVANSFRSAESLTKFFSKILLLLQKGWNTFVADQLGYSRIGASFSDPYLEEFELQVVSFLKRRADGVLDFTLDNLNLISDLVAKGDQLWKGIPSDRQFDNIKKLLYDRLNDLRRIEMEFRNSNLGQSGFRQEPVGLLLRGGPGTQKSTLLEHFAAALNASTLGDEDKEIFKINPHAFTFNRQFENSFWDGYPNKTNVILFDDYGQARDLAGNPDNEHMNIIRCINSFEMALHTANMNQKGKLKNHAKFVLATTNQQKLVSQSIISVEALNRRFTHQYTVVPKREYCQNPSDDYFSQKIDFSKMPVKDGQPDPRPEHFLFLNMEDDVVIETLSFGDVMDRMISSFHARKVWMENHKLNFMKTACNYGLQTQAATEYSESVYEEARESFTLPGYETLNDAKVDVDLLITAIGEYKAYAFMSTRQYFPEALLFVEQNLEHFLKIFGNPPVQCSTLWVLMNLWLHDQDAVVKCTWHDISLLRLGPNLPWIPRPRPKFEIEERENIRDEIKRTFSEKYPKFQIFMSQIVSFKSSTWMIIASLIAGVVGGSLIGRSSKKSETSDTHNERVVSSKKDETFFIDEDGKKNCFIYDDIEGQMEYQHPKGGKKIVGKKHISLAKMKAISTQAGDMSGKQILTKILRGNTYKFYVKSEKRTKHSGSVVGLESNYFLMPMHYMAIVLQLVEDGEFEISDHIEILDNEDRIVAKSEIKLFIQNSSDEKLEGSDTMVVRMDACRPIVNIISYFLSERNLAHLPRIFPITTHLNSEDAYVMTDASLASVETDDYILQKGISYAADTAEGDCGSPLAVRISNFGKQRLVGIHVAGQPKGHGVKAYAGVVTQESLMSIISTFKGFVEVPLDDIEPQSSCTFMYDKYAVLGKVKKGFHHSPYGKTKIIPTSINQGQSKTKPAILTKKGGIDPFSVALKKYCVSEAVPDPKILERAVEDYTSFLESKDDWKDRKILSVAESLWGSDTMDYFESIKSSTSSGYPIKFVNPSYKGKLLGEGAVRDQSNPYFSTAEREVSGIIKDCANGVRRLWVFTDNLKDERRPIGKNARLFNGGPFYYLIVFRMYFGSFMNFMNAKSSEIGSSLTMNVYSSEWDDLYRRLSRFSSNPDFDVGAGDFSAYDGSELPVVHWKIFDIIDNWYSDGPLNSKIRKILWLEVVNSRHVVGDTIYEWFASLPSGHPLTIIINCMYNHIAFRYCWYRDQTRWFLKFNDFVELHVLGDDNIFTVNSLFKLSFNELTLPESMKELGMTYTTELKAEAEVPFRKISEVGYLKRSFRFEPLLGQYVAPLSMESLVEIPLWSKVNMTQAIFHTNLEVFVKELSLHSKDVWEENMKHLKFLIRTYGQEDFSSVDIFQNRSYYLSKVTNVSSFI